MSEAYDVILVATSFFLQNVGLYSGILLRFKRSLYTGGDIGYALNTLFL